MNANEIIRQIGPSALMRVGAHTFMTDRDSLIFHTGRGHRNKIIVAYSHALDLYSVKTLKIKRDLSLIERHVADEVGCEQLAEIIGGLS